MKAMDNHIKLSGENFECFPLDWDTEYFGVKAARVNLKGIITEENQMRILQYCKAFDFISISNIGNTKENNYWIGKASNAFLTDINIQFIKEIKGEPILMDKTTEVHNSYPRDQKVISIASSAFSYSRFFNDNSLPEKQAKNIYLHWTECAFNMDNKYFVIAKRNNEVAGYILFSLNEVAQSATIELIAVDESYRGERVGSSLVSALESFVYEHGVNDIKVGTQVDNISATKFYIARGFQYVSCSSVYHLWMDNKL